MERTLLQELLDLDRVNYHFDGRAFLCGEVGFIHHEVDRNFFRHETRELYLNYLSKGVQLYQVAGSISAIKMRNFIRAKLGLLEKIGARKCNVISIEANEFYQINQKWHIQGGASSHVRYGLIYKERLIAAVGFTKTQNEWNLNRMVFGDVAVIGGASKLINAFIQEYNPKSITTFSNNGYSDGGVYRSLGFIQVNESPIDMWYAKSGILLNRRNFQKKKLGEILPNYDSEMTEVDNMKNAGYFVYYGPGTKRWELKGEFNENK